MGLTHQPKQIQQHPQALGSLHTELFHGSREQPVIARQTEGDCQETTDRRTGEARPRPTLNGKFLGLNLSPGLSLALHPKIH